MVSVIASIIGIVLILSGLFPQYLNVASTTQLALVILGVVVLLWAVLRRRFAPLYSVIAINGLSLLLLLAVLEVGAAIYNRVTVKLPEQATDTAYLPDDEDAAVILREIHEPSFDPELYVGWRNRPYRGKSLTIDADGLRVTPGASTEPGAVKVFMFGGSTLWGEGAPDERTIPAYLQQQLSAAIEAPIQVTNFGQRAWVSTQNVVQLILQLEKGNIPDVVVFYDGYNDVFAGYVTGRTGVPENFSQLGEFKQEYRTAKQTLLRFALKTQLGKMVKSLQPVPPDPRANIDVDRLSGEIVATYQEIIRVVQSLGIEYGFESLFYWQPQLAVGNKPLTTAEEDIRQHHPWLSPLIQRLTDATYAKVRTATDQSDVFIDFSDVFDTTEEHVYIDPCHVTSVGNRVIATAMLETGLRDAVSRQAGNL